MGMSLDADIMYGMVLRDGEGETLVEAPWMNDDSGDGDEDFDGWIAEQLGLEPLDYSTYPERTDDLSISYQERYAKLREMQEAWGREHNTDAYYKKKRELLSQVPVEIDGGGTDGYHTVILRLKASPKLNAYYKPSEFDPKHLEVRQPDDADASAFLAKYGVIWSPKWLLVPSYG